MPDPIQGVPVEEGEELPQFQAADSLVAPAGFFTENTDEAQVERLEAWRASEQESKRKDGRTFARKAYEAIAEPAARAVTKAVDATSDFAVGVGGYFVDKGVKL